MAFAPDFRLNGRVPVNVFCHVLLGFIALMPLSAIADTPVDWKGVTHIATGGGERGPWQQNESRYNYVDDPTVALDSDGQAYIAWVDQARKDVLFQRVPVDGTKLFLEPVNISRSPSIFSWLPRIALAPDASGKLFALWQEIIFSGGSHGGEMLFARSDDGGKTFSEPINLSNSIGGDGKGRVTREVWHNGSYDLVAGADGSVFAAWTEYDGPLWFARSSDGGRSFSRPVRLAGGGSDKPARAPSLALGKDGTIYLAWTNGETNSADIHVASSRDGGATFSSPHIVAPSDGYSDAPDLLVDSKGVLHMVYGESEAGPFNRYHVLYTHSTDGARGFQQPRRISSLDPESNTSASFPELDIDRRGNLYALWEHFPSYGSRPYGLKFTVSLNGGRSFAPPESVPGSTDPEGGSNGSHQGSLMEKLAVNGAGRVAVVNSSLKEGGQSRVWLMRGEMQR
jgi:hypothetical protein